MVIWMKGYHGQNLINYWMLPKDAKLGKFTGTSPPSNDHNFNIFQAKSKISVPKIIFSSRAILCYLQNTRATCPEMCSKVLQLYRSKNSKWILIGDTIPEAVVPREYRNINLTVLVIWKTSFQFIRHVLQYNDIF